MAAFETRDFLGMLDCLHDYHYPANPNSSFSSSLLHLSLKLTESDCSNNAERACEEAEATTTTTPAPINGSSTSSTTSYSGNKRSAEESVWYGGNENATIIRQPRAILTAPLSSSSSSSFSSSYCVKWEGLMHPLIWKGSIRPLRIPLSRKASLTRFFQKRNERVKNLRLNGHKFTSDRSAASCLEPRTSQAIDAAHPRFEPNTAYAKRQCVHS